MPPVALKSDRSLPVFPIRASPTLESTMNLLRTVIVARFEKWHLTDFLKSQRPEDGQARIECHCNHRLPLEHWSTKVELLWLVNDVQYLDTSLPCNLTICYFGVIGCSVILFNLTSKRGLAFNEKVAVVRNRLTDGRWSVKVNGRTSNLTFFGPCASTKHVHTDSIHAWQFWYACYAYIRDVNNKIVSTMKSGSKHVKNVPLWK